MRITVMGYFALIMKKIIGVLTIMAATFCNAESNNGLVFQDMPPEYRGCSIGMMPDGVIIAKVESIDKPIQRKILSWEEWNKSWDNWRNSLSNNLTYEQ